jgi:mRNA interferase RelE/StbE
MAEVTFTRRAMRDLDRLDPAIRRRILAKLRELAGEPLASAKKLTDPRIGTFRWRIGDYRAIFDIEEETVVVLRVGDRKDIYSQPQRDP